MYGRQDRPTSCFADHAKGQEPQSGRMAESTPDTLGTPFRARPACSGVSDQSTHACPLTALLRRPLVAAGHAGSCLLGRVSCYEGSVDKDDPPLATSSILAPCQAMRWALLPPCSSRTPWGSTSTPADAHQPLPCNPRAATRAEFTPQTSQDLADPSTGSRALPVAAQLSCWPRVSVSVSWRVGQWWRGS